MSLCQYVLRPRRGLGQALQSLEAPRLQALETRDLFHQQNRKGKIVMTKTSRYKGLVLGSFLVPEIDMIFWRRSWGLPCRNPSGPNGPTTNWITSAKSYRRWERNLCENKAVAILEPRCRPENEPSSKKMEEPGHLRRPKHWWKLLTPSSKRSPGSYKTNRTTQLLHK